VRISAEYSKYFLKFLILGSLVGTYNSLQENCRHFKCKSMVTVINREGKQKSVEGKSKHIYELEIQESLHSGNED
jgi:hypothetical protein